MGLNKAVLIIIDGMDTANYTMGFTPVMSGLHGKATVGIAHTEVIGAGTAITPIAHAMMGTGANAIAHRPGRDATGRPFDYYGRPLQTIGDVARQEGLLTAAVGKNEAAIVLGGTDVLDISHLEMDGVDATDVVKITGLARAVLTRMDSGILVINFAGVDYFAHRKDVGAVIEMVEYADWMVAEVVEAADLRETIVIIAADHGTNAFTGDHNSAPTPLCLITGAVEGRVNLGIVHNLEIAATIAAAHSLPRPEQAMGRDLLHLASAGEGEKNYAPILQTQMALLMTGPKRHLAPV